MISTILAVQKFVLIFNSLQKSSLADVGEISFNLDSPSNDHPCYTIYVLDQPKIRDIKSYAAFIVPHAK